MIFTSRPEPKKASGDYRCIVVEEGHVIDLFERMKFIVELLDRELIDQEMAKHAIRNLGLDWGRAE